MENSSNKPVSKFDSYLRGLVVFCVAVIVVSDLWPQGFAGSTIWIYPLLVSMVVGTELVMYLDQRHPGVF